MEKEAKELRKTGEQVKQQSEFLSSVLESLFHPFYVIDAHDYSIKLANSSAQFGRLSGESTCYALTHKRQAPCDSTEHPCPLEIIKRTKRPVVVEHIHFDKTGNQRSVEAHGYPIFDNEGNVSQMIEYTFDITERKQIEKERDQLILDLQSSLAKVKTLSGLLPICASCKKIRDDKGYWNQIEGYIRKHSNATFSHGICPECTEKLYPDYCAKKKIQLTHQKIAHFRFGYLVMQSFNAIY